MRVAMLCAILIGSLSACATPPRGAGLAEAAEAIGRDLDELERAGLSGQILVRHGETTLVARALGTLRPDSDEAVSMESVMPLASISKAFTASAMLALAADGRLNLDDPIGAYLPGLSPAWYPVPVRHLLTHTSGLPAEIFNPGWAGHPRFEPVSRTDMLRRINQFQPEHAPGALFRYSNIAYNLAAAVVEAISGQSLESFQHQRLFRPAGIRDIGLLLPDWQDAELVVARTEHAASGHHLEQPRLDDGLGWHNRGSGDLLARPRAMAEWWQTLRRRDWLPEPWMGEFLDPQIELADGSAYGFGLQFRSGRYGRAVGHTGSEFDFSVDWSWYMEHELFIYVALADGRWQADRVREQLVQRVFMHW